MGRSPCEWHICTSRFRCCRSATRRSSASRWPSGVESTPKGSSRPRCMRRERRFSAKTATIRLSSSIVALWFIFTRERESRSGAYGAHCSSPSRIAHHITASRFPDVTTSYPCVAILLPPARIHLISAPASLQRSRNVARHRLKHTETTQPSQTSQTHVSRTLCIALVYPCVAH
jgi:hypothetical protein